ncbi:MAG: polymerase, sigma-24 subunit, subfamily [Bradyrhizobium sp.]|nr:polymerase, sigma-24 subunit, subfamily [Bradyrhizobium sp.]
MTPGGKSSRQATVEWVAREVIPREPAVRRWLKRSLVAKEDIDDLIQEAYCRMVAMDGHDHVVSASAFFFQVVRNLLLNRVKRAKVVRIETGVELELISDAGLAPSQEQVLEHRREWERVSALIPKLPDRCRMIFEMRKIQGFSQREIAEELGLSENVVENESAKGLRLLLQELRAQGSYVEAHYVRKRPPKGRTH